MLLNWSLFYSYADLLQHSLLLHQCAQFREIPIVRIGWIFIVFAWNVCLYLKNYYFRCKRHMKIAWALNTPFVLKACVCCAIRASSQKVVLVSEMCCIFKHHFTIIRFILPVPPIRYTDTLHVQSENMRMLGGESIFLFFQKPNENDNHAKQIELWKK